MKIKLDIDLNEFVQSIFENAWDDEDCPAELVDELKQEVISQAGRKVVDFVEKTSIDEAKRIVAEKASEFARAELEGLIIRKLRSGELRLSNRSGSFANLDELIQGQIYRGEIERDIERYIDKKMKQLSKDLQERYDSYFAAQVIKSLKANGMLSDNMDKMLSDNGQGDK